MTDQHDPTDPAERAGHHALTGAVEDILAETATTTDAEVMEAVREKRVAHIRHRRVRVAVLSAAASIAVIVATFVAIDRSDNPGEMAITSSGPTATARADNPSGPQGSDSTSRSSHTSGPPSTQRTDPCADSATPTVPTTLAGSDQTTLVFACTIDGFWEPAVVHRVGPPLKNVIDLVAEGPTEAEQAKGFTVGAGGSLQVTTSRSGSDVTIDLDSSIKQEFPLTPTNSGALFIPLVGTAFLDPAVEQVTITLDGSAEAAATWAQVVAPLSWTRAEMANTFGHDRLSPRD